MTSVAGLLDVTAIDRGEAMNATPMQINVSNTAFILICVSLVMLVTPGLSFFYGGLVGRRNVLSIMIQSFISLHT